ncbi:MAG: pseudouridine synthase [Bacilli bacterium]|jgi:23S rRNA pseudouridine1911/1915/1917 synthase|nr:pseudouridine synthase [Bacilli bacterium]
MKRSFDTVYEDKEILVVTKKSGLLTIGTDNDPYHNLYHYVRDYLNQKRQRVFVVHRLDRDTSGLVIFAKSFGMKDDLQLAFEREDVGRYYEAIVKEKIPDGKQFKVEEYLAYDERSGNTYVTHDPSEGKKAITLIKADHTNKLGTVLSIQILTGRKNQIRLALKTLGLTLLGDKKYTDDDSKRMFLNAYRLVFPVEIGLRKNDFAISPLWLGKREDNDEPRLG